MNSQTPQPVTPDLSLILNVLYGISYETCEKGTIKEVASFIIHLK